MNVLVFLIVLISGVPLVCMQLLSISSLKKDIRREERIKSHREALRIADRHYKNMIRNTKYNVHQQIIIRNESDIEW